MLDLEAVKLHGLMKDHIVPGQMDDALIRADADVPLKDAEHLPEVMHLPLKLVIAAIIRQKGRDKAVQLHTFFHREGFIHDRLLLKILSQVHPALPPARSAAVHFPFTAGFPDPANILWPKSYILCLKSNISSINSIINSSDPFCFTR